MTPKQKAEELFDKMCMNDGDEYHHCTHYVAKKCSLIAVNEILEATKTNWKTQRLMPNGGPYNYKIWEGVSYKKYWKEVKQEIEAL